MREIDFREVTNADTIEDMCDKAARNSGYLGAAASVLDCAGLPSADNKLMPNGMIVIESYYAGWVALYCLPDGEIVRLIDNA